MFTYNNIASKLLKKEIITTSILCVIVIGYSVFFKDHSQAYWLKLKEEKQWNDFKKSTQKIYTLVAFNPNLYTLLDWQNIGFSIKQAKTIVNFKEKYCKGKIESKQQLKECFAINEKRFAELSPYLLLPENSPKKEYKIWEYKTKSLQVYKAFNPNDLSVEDWQNMGLSEKKALGMMKYKAYLGGAFHSKQEMANSYALKGNYFEQIKNFILLPETWQKPAFESKYPSKTKIELHNFNPNLYEKEDWMKIGFSENQALGILNYKEKICKGKFTTLDQLAACYMLKQRFEELKNYFIFETIANEKPNSEDKIDTTNWELNTMKYQDFISFGFNSHSAASLVAFRKSLGGFQSKIQLKEAYQVNTQLVDQLVKVVKLNKTGVLQFSLTTVDENTLKQHPYFRYYADKILYFRQSNLTNEKILSAVKVPMEDKVKMYWYLKD